MNDLAGPWAGRIYGTNTGNLFLEIDQADNVLSGNLSFMDDQFGLVKYSFSGMANEEIVLNCNPEGSPDGVILGSATVRGSLQSDGTITGRWETTIGTVGMFRVWPHASKIVENKANEPEQIFNRLLKVGSVRIFLNDLEALFENIQKDFILGKLVVTYKQDENQIVKFYDSFLSKIDQLKELRELNLFIQESEASGISRSVNVELLDNGESTIRVIGGNESWVVGKAESIRQAISRYENKFVTLWRKYGLVLNSIIFLAMIAFAPEIVFLLDRIIFVGSVFILLLILYSIHIKFIPNTMVILDKSAPGFWSKFWPSIVSWGMGIASAVIAALIFSWLNRGS